LRRSLSHHMVDDKNWLQLRLLQPNMAYCNTFRVLDSCIETELATREGEWMGADKNSSQGRCLLQQDELGQNNTFSTRTTQVYQSHIATQVLLTLGANHSTNWNKTLPTLNRNLHSLLSVPHRSDRWLTSVRSVTPARKVDVDIANVVD
jgi:hypothetical protein